MNDSFDDGLG
jgi:hypothetical protein